MIKKFLIVIVSLIFVLGIVYLVLPYPSSINSFPGLPYSTKSDLDGDTWQHPNISAYFSQLTRDEVTAFYRQQLQSQFWVGKIISPLTQNRPPEEAYQYIRDQQQSTFLEEYVYPFKGALFVNGYEPIVENGGSIDFVSDHIEFKNQYYISKTTLRFYPTSRKYSIAIYLGIWLALFGLYKMGRIILKLK